MKLMSALLAFGAADSKVNYTTVFRTGESGFGCMRFPQVHNVNRTSLFVFVECYNKSGDHCDATAMGFPNAANPHAYAKVCYKRSSDEGQSWGKLQVAPSQAARGARRQETGF